MIERAASRPGSLLIRRRWTRWLFAASGFIPLLALLSATPDPTLLIYSLFVLLYLLRPRPAPLAYTRGTMLRFGLAIIGCGLLVELLSWTNNFIECAPEPALLHPQLAPDLLLALGFYGAWGLAWLLGLRFFRFDLRQMFITQGLFGILIEQRGGILIAGLLSLPLGIVLWLYVFLVYGSAMGLAAILAGIPEHAQARAGSWWKYVLVWIAVLVSSLVFTGLWGALLNPLGLVPAPQPICTNPLW
ncbi:MAG: hypothetical protein H7Z42_00865 [Roseiflexaceae bacterium]|nr:hypothetical protein [Roseiflexaceae bacterium]